MIPDSKTSPVKWGIMLMELDDTAEHIRDLTDQMQREGGIDEEDFRIQIFHVMTHLNRIWNGRHYPENLAMEKFAGLSDPPEDFQPTG